ncbi:metal-dependent hydrolase [Tautonia marina]|uniref:metal-dependent hydrolase n=1 Tax=Tautonia marina TaxID=2653855 RepID=UPI001260B452|nr:metal-dependent hydrolase [Tautonia marina]
MDFQGVRITWLGHSTFLLTSPEGQTLLVDPFLANNPKCPKPFHDVSCDAIAITHGHADHLADVFSAAKRCSGKIVGMYDLTGWLGSKGIDSAKLLGMNKGGSICLGSPNIALTMTDARHSSSWTEQDGTIVYLGEAAGYVATFSNGFKIYIAGDTCLFGDMSLIRELYAPDLAILPIGDHFTMDPRAAAFACRLLGVKAVIPCHYGTFPPLIGTPDQLRAQIDHLGLSTEVFAPEPGETVG